MRAIVGLPVALLYLLGTVAIGPAPAHAATTVPTVSLTGKLIKLADQLGPGLAALRTADKQLVPVDAKVVKRLKSGSAVTLNVVVPANVRSVAAANSTLTVRSPNGDLTSTPLDSGDLAAASDGTPEKAASDLGRATVASAASTGQALAVSAVVAAADPVGTYTPATRHLFVAVVTPKGWLPVNAINQGQINAQVSSASSYWSTVSGGGVTLDVATATAVAPRYPSAYTCSQDPWLMWSEATTRTGFAGAPNTSLVVELPPNATGCSYGLGTVGANVNDDGMLYVADNAFPVLAHELGHNMSLQHADTLQCPSASDSAFNGTSWTGTGCQEVSYGDGADVMASSLRTSAPFLSAPQSLRTGIIPPSAATVISTPGTASVILNALGSGSGTRVAEVVDPANNVVYYVEYRVATSPDTPDVNGDALGVRVQRFNPAPPGDVPHQSGDTVLLDPTPSSTVSSDGDATLHQGATFTSYSGAVQVTTLATSAATLVTPATATISITTALTAPSAPTAVKAIAGDTQAAVSWTAPSSTGGSGLLGYTVTAAPGGSTFTTSDASSTTATMTGLTNGTSYTFTVTATNAIGESAPSAASAPIMPMAPGGFTGQTPTRVLDTRSSVGGHPSKLGAGATMTLTLPAPPTLPAGANAVALNVTVTGGTATSSLTVYPGGQPRPTVESNLNFVASQTIPNLVIVPLGPGNTVTFYNNAGTVNVIADLVGSYAPGAGGKYTGTPPTRVLDTRTSVGGHPSKLGAGAIMTLTVPASALAAGANAVALNVTVTGPTVGGYLTVYPSGTTRPTASNLNFVVGQTIPNMVMVPLGPGNKVTFYNSAGTVNVIADLVGSYVPGPGTGGMYSGRVLNRVLDTRTSIGGHPTKLGAGATMTLTVPGLPPGATAVALSVTVTGPTVGGYLTVYPSGTTRPTASNLNYLAGQTISNLVVVPLGPLNTVTFFNAAGTIHVVAALAGSFAP